MVLLGTRVLLLGCSIEVLDSYKFCKLLLLNKVIGRIVFEQMNRSLISELANGHTLDILILE